MLPVNEIFSTFQGEAYFTGTPSTFIRLQGCPVGCPWCDTKHTWLVRDENHGSPAAVLEKVEDSPLFCWFKIEDLVERCLLEKPRHIVITGGEPCLYDLANFTALLSLSGFTVQVETSGTQPINVCTNTWVTVSPKLDMPGGLAVLPEALRRANEIKMPVGRERDIDKLRDLLDTMKLPPPLVWLQPLSQSKTATDLCLRAAADFGWRVSIQTHKFLGVR